MIIENNTLYYDRLKRENCVWYTDLWCLCSDLMKGLPQLTDDFYYEALKQGGANLNSTSQMTSYLGYYGRFYGILHSCPFDIFPYEFYEKQKINIVHYGCGMGIWTVIYDYYSDLTCNRQWVNTVTLIEPSKLLLKRAALHATVFYPEANIRTINKELDDLTQEDIVCDESVPTLHIFTDVLEKTDFDMGRLARLVNNSLKGYNQFFCVQLYFDNYQNDNRVSKFASFFTDEWESACAPPSEMELVYEYYPMLKGICCAYTMFAVEVDDEYKERNTSGCRLNHPDVVPAPNLYQDETEESVSEEDKFGRFVEVLMERLSLRMEDGYEMIPEEIVYQFPEGIRSEAGKTILTIDFLTTSSGKSINDLMQLDEEEVKTKVSLKSVMAMVPENEMDIIGKELHDATLQQIYREVKMKVFEEYMLMRWRARLKKDERLKLEDGCVCFLKDI